MMPWCNPQIKGSKIRPGTRDQCFPKNQPAFISPPMKAALFRESLEKPARHAEAKVSELNIFNVLGGGRIGVQFVTKLYLGIFGSQVLKIVFRCGCLVWNACLIPSVHGRFLRII